MAIFSDTSVFELHEQESFWDNPYLSRYSTITKAQLLGLLTALGEYALREPMWPSVVGSDPALSNPHTTMLRFYRRQIRAWVHFPGTPTSRHAFNGIDLPLVSTDPSEFVFDAAERESVPWNKYNKGFGDLTKRHLVTFLEALGRYSLKAPIADQIASRFEGRVRHINAHNALVTFRDRPFTTDEFFASVREAVARVVTA